MSPQNAYTLHIFAPYEKMYGDSNWVEQILGSIVRPLYQEHGKDIKWLWITRYVEPQNANKDVAYPDNATSLNNGYYRYVAFRISVEDEQKQIVLDRAIELAQNSGCFTDPRGWLDYDVISDLGKNRFIRADASAGERARRAHLVISFVDATVRLMLDSIVQDTEGKWSREPNTDDQNPKG